MRQIVEGPFYMFGEPKLDEVNRVFRDLENLDDMLMRIGVTADNQTPIYKLAGIVTKDEGNEEVDVLVTGYKRLFVPTAYAKGIKITD